MSSSRVRGEPLSLGEVIDRVSHPSQGAIATFIGVVREQNEGRSVTLLEYEAYGSMADAEMGRIEDELSKEMKGVRVAALHRIGALSVGDIAVVCAASAPHRAEAFIACRALIDRIKERAPIWKREHGPDGAYWVGWVDARCRADGEHSGHDHGARDR
jgi:molybdopterin synthase catalytic subunit